MTFKLKTICVSSLLFSCGNMTAYNPDSAAIRGQLPSDAAEDITGTGGSPGIGGMGVGGSIGVGGTNGVGGMIGVGGLTGNGGSVTNPDANLDANLNCSHCKLNCVYNPIDLNDPNQVAHAFSWCEGCISNCPVNGLALYCTCHVNGCGYDPQTGTCD